MEKKELLYRGKAKSLFSTQDPDRLMMEYRNDLSAFNGVKLAQLERKGLVNNRFNAFMMKKLETEGILTHFVERVSDTESLVKSLTMIPVECVVRNATAGGLCKRYGIQEGLDLEPALFEFFLKDDALGDPLITEAHILAFQWATHEEIEIMKNLSFKINEILKPLFLKVNLKLVDYKLEFGRDKEGRLTLGDEFTPDGCRIWDTETGEILDKDRFRRDLGQVVESYEEVARRFGIDL